MKTAVMYGAGNIGRGFIGALLAHSGYHVTFIDVAEDVIDAINALGRYPVCTSDGVTSVSSTSPVPAARRTSIWRSVPVPASSS